MLDQQITHISKIHKVELQFIDMFLSTSPHRSWILLSREILVKWMKCMDINDISNFYKNLINNYNTDIDFQEIDKNDLEFSELQLNLYPNIPFDQYVDINSIDPNKHYIITIECLNKLLISIQPQELILEIMDFVDKSHNKYYYVTSRNKNWFKLIDGLCNIRYSS
jgi:hypothetical protein